MSKAGHYVLSLRASAGSWTPSVGPRVRTRETVNASGGAERTAPLIRHRSSSDSVAQLIGAVARSTRGDVLIKSTIAGGCVYHASRLRTVGRDLADARHRTTRLTTAILGVVRLKSDLATL